MRVPTPRQSKNTNELDRLELLTGLDLDGDGDVGQDGHYTEGSAPSRMQAVHERDERIDALLAVDAKEAAWKEARAASKRVSADCEKLPRRAS